MNPFTFAVVGLRLLAVYCLIHAVTPLFQALGYWAGGIAAGERFAQTYPIIFSNTLPAVVLAGFAVLLFWYSEPLARRLAPPVSAETLTGCSFEQAQTLAFAAAGILILVTSVPAVLQSLGNVLELSAGFQRAGLHSAWDPYQIWTRLGGAVVESGFGLWLMLNPRGFRNAWHWLRTAGS